MISLKIKLNDSKPIIVNGKGLSHLQADISGQADIDNSVDLHVWGYDANEDSYIQHTWIQEKLNLNDRVIVESIESESKDDPVKTEDFGPYIATCSFCQKKSDEVTCLIEGKHKMAHICDECVEVCVQAIADYKLKNDA